MEKIRTVIWDCDNVIWFHKKEETQIMANALGITDVEEFSVEFFSMINCFNSHFANKRVTLRETYKIIERAMPILCFYGISSEKFMKVWNELKIIINQFNEDALVIMEDLYEKGIKNIIKTDWWRDTQIVLLKEYGILRYIEKLYSCDNAYLKCNPLSAKGIITQGKEAEYVIIGDSLFSDIAFAKHTGIKSIWLNRDGKQNGTQFKPTYEITSLLEVIDII